MKYNKNGLTTLLLKAIFFIEGGFTYMFSHDRQPRLGVGLVSRGNIIIRPPGASQSTCA